MTAAAHINIHVHGANENDKKKFWRRVMRKSRWRADLPVCVTSNNDLVSYCWMGCCFDVDGIGFFFLKTGGVGGRETRFSLIRSSWDHAPCAWQKGRKGIWWRVKTFLRCRLCASSAYFSVYLFPSASWAEWDSGAVYFVCWKETR